MKSLRTCITLIIGIGMFFLCVFQVSAQELTSDEKVIVKDTGSTNNSGYQMVIEPSGLVKVTLENVRRNSVYADGQYNVPPNLVKPLIVDLNAVMPLTNLSGGSCAKSASFGTSTYVTYKGQTSPDIQCMKREEFVDDVYTIIGKIPRAPRD